MPDHQGDPENCGKPGDNDWVDKGLAGVVGASAGVVVGAGVDPTLGALVAPVVTEALLAFGTRFNAKQLARASQVWNVAAEICEVEPQELSAKADDPAKEFLLAAALKSGANSLTVAKVTALGKVLADGLSDDAMVDTTMMLALALGDIEAPHIHVLDYIAGDSTPFGTPRAVNLDQFLVANTGYRTSISAIVATLERHGIIRTEVETGLVSRPPQSPSVQFPIRYRVTVFGHELLDRLRESVDSPPTHGG